MIFPQQIENLLFIRRVGQRQYPVERPAQRRRRDKFARVRIAEVQADLVAERLLRHLRQMPAGRDPGGQKHNIQHSLPLRLYGLQKFVVVTDIIRRFVVGIRRNAKHGVLLLPDHLAPDVVLHNQSLGGVVQQHHSTCRSALWAWPPRWVPCGAP